jgi:hypothetical protein
MWAKESFMEVTRNIWDLIPAIPEAQLHPALGFQEELNILTVNSISLSVPIEPGVGLSEPLVPCVTQPVRGLQQFGWEMQSLWLHAEVDNYTGDKQGLETKAKLQSPRT